MEKKSTCVLTGLCMLFLCLLLFFLADRLAALLLGAPFSTWTRICLAAVAVAIGSRAGREAWTGEGARKRRRVAEQSLPAYLGRCGGTYTVIMIAVLALGCLLNGSASPLQDMRLWAVIAGGLALTTLVSALGWRRARREATGAAER